MKKIILTAAAMILSAVLLLTVGVWNFSAADNADTAALSARVDRYISLYEYGKAVRLIEKYPDITADPAFDKAKNILLVHYTEIAKGYFEEAECFLTRQLAYGDETVYDKEGRLSPENFKEHLTAEEMTAFDRAVIIRQRDEENENYTNTFVKIEIFGKTAVYPPEDITLDKRTKVTNEYTDSETLLEDVKTNMGIYRYAAAVKLLEENPRLSGKPEFDDVKAELLVHFTEQARQMYIHACTHITKQEILGYTLDDGCEGYDRENRRLDPGVLSYLTSMEKGVVNRTEIICTNEKAVDLKVKINFCGMTAYYSANDVRV